MVETLASAVPARGQAILEASGSSSTGRGGAGSGGASSRAATSVALVLTNVEHIAIFGFLATVGVGKVIQLVVLQWWAAFDGRREVAAATTGTTTRRSTALKKVGKGNHRISELSWDNGKQQGETNN